MTNPESPRLNPQWTWIYAGAIVLYALVVGIGVIVFRWTTFADVAVPALAIAVWMEYVYLRYRRTGRHLGIFLSGLGWLAVGLAFLLRGPGASLYFLRLVFSLLGFIAILAGGALAFAETGQPTRADTTPSVDSPARDALTAPPREESREAGPAAPT